MDGWQCFVGITSFTTNKAWEGILSITPLQYRLLVDKFVSYLTGMGFKDLFLAYSHRFVGAHCFLNFSGFKPYSCLLYLGSYEI